MQIELNMYNFTQIVDIGNDFCTIYRKSYIKQVVNVLDPKTVTYSTANNFTILVFEHYSHKNIDGLPIFYFTRFE